MIPHHSNSNSTAYSHFQDAPLAVLRWVGVGAVGLGLVFFLVWGGGRVQGCRSFPLELNNINVLLTNANNTAQSSKENEE